jgi:predicted phage-related endonuclease
MEGRGYIGGSAIAGILGISPFQTPLDIYLSIIEGNEVIDSEKQAFFEDRKALEPWAVAKFERRTGLKVVAQNVRYTDEFHSNLRAEIDFETEDHSNGETKTVREKNAWMWGDDDDELEPPMYVTSQVQWGFGIRDALRGYVNACIGFDQHKVYTLFPDDDLIAELRDRAFHFWKFHIEPKRMPQPSSLDDVLKLYGRDTGRAVEATTEVLQAMEARDRAVRKLKLHGTEKLDAELTIKKYMRDAATLTRNGIVIATWKANSLGIRVFNCK